MAASGAPRSRLQVAAGAPLLLLEQVTFSADDTPVECSNSWINPTRMTISSLVQRNHTPEQSDATTHTGEHCQTVRMIRCVVFDLGQVLSSPPTLYTEAAALLGVDAAAYEDRYWTGRRAYDVGGSDASYWAPR